MEWTFYLIISQLQKKIQLSFLNPDLKVEILEEQFKCTNFKKFPVLLMTRYDYEYDLILKPDYYTRGHTQWYYFSVANIRKDKVHFWMI